MSDLWDLGIALEEAGAAYETIRVDFANAEQTKPAYLAINPKGRVPALMTDRGLLTENVAILAYIAQSFPEKKLAPSDPFAFAQMQAFNSYLSSTVHVNHAHKGRGYRWASEESSFADMKRKVPETMAASFDLIEREMFRGPWVMGDDFTVADAYLFTVSNWCAPVVTRVKMCRRRSCASSRPVASRFIPVRTPCCTPRTRSSCGNG